MTSEVFKVEILKSISLFQEKMFNILKLDPYLHDQLLESYRLHTKKSTD